MAGTDNATATLPETNEGQIASGTLTVTDVDLTDTVGFSVDSLDIGGTGEGSIPVALTPQMLEGFLTLAPTTSGDDPLAAAGGTTSNLTWYFDFETEAFDFLAQNEQLDLTYAVAVTDSNGATVYQDVAISITGTNDAPIAVNDAFDLSTLGNVLDNDTDLDDILSVTKFSVKIDGGQTSSDFMAGENYVYVSGDDLVNISVGSNGQISITGDVIILASSTVEVAYSIRPD